MQVQTPAMGISAQCDYNDYKSYVIECDCTDTDHAHILSVEAEADDNIVSVCIYTKSITPFWKLSRWRMLWNLLISGKVNYEVALVLQRQQALNYASAIINAIDTVTPIPKR